MRLDIYLVEEGFVKSRTKAQEIIKQNNVLVNHIIINKPSFIINENDKIEVKENIISQYVGRGSQKLTAALESFQIDVKGKFCLDVGVSTGGFSQVLLEKEADFVIGVDTGTNQIDDELLNFPNFKVFENQDIRDFDTDKNFDLVVVDVSFISVLKIIDKIVELMAEDGEIIQLFKPQFELEERKKYKKGVLKDKKIHFKAFENFQKHLKLKGLFVENMIYSPIKGGSGNIEYLLKISKKENTNNINYITIIESAFCELKNK